MKTSDLEWPAQPMTDEELVEYVRSRYPVGPRGENGLLHDLADRIERLNGLRRWVME